MSEVKQKLKTIPVADRTPGKRCSDYDSDCSEVPDHYACWAGTDPYYSLGLGQADGYCPFLIGME